MALSNQLAPTRAIVLMAKAAQNAGCTVSESQPYGAVHKVHAKGSWHYETATFAGKRYSLAIDINHPARGEAEFKALAGLARVAKNLGVSYIHASHGTQGAAATHRTHGHADVGEWSSLGKGDFRTSRRDITAAGLQDDTNAPIDNDWGPTTDKHLDAVRAASKMGGGKFPEGIEFAQKAVGTRSDGDWGPKSRKAHDDAVKRIQRTLADANLYSGAIDGIWGERTDSGLKQARKRARG